MRLKRCFRTSASRYARRARPSVTASMPPFGCSEPSAPWTILRSTGRSQLPTSSRSQWLCSLLRCRFIRARTLGTTVFWPRCILDIAQDLAARNIGLVLRAYPDHSLLKFCEEVRPAIVLGDENPLRQPEEWRVRVAQKIRVTAVDRGCGCDRAPEALLKEQFAARTIRPRIHH